MAQTLGQIVGIHKSTKTAAQRDFDTIYKYFQKDSLFKGFTKIHTPEEGNLQQPATEQLVQANAYELLAKMEETLVNAFDVEATKDTADTNARANIIIGSNTILENVPVSHLLWLEKQFTNFVTVFRAIPVQSAAENWTTAPNLPNGMVRTPEEVGQSTKKITEFPVIVPPTPEHPAQVREVTRDVVSGTWRTVKYTAAITIQEKDTLIKRSTELLNATKQAIVAANHTEAIKVQEGEKIFNFLFDGIGIGG